MLVARTWDTILEIFIVYGKVARDGWVQRALLGENHSGVSYEWTPTALLGDDLNMFSRYKGVNKWDQVARNATWGGSLCFHVLLIYDVCST